MTREELLAKVDEGEVIAGEDLSGLDLSGLDLSGVVFEKTSFRGARLKDAKLSESMFNGCDLCGADLSGARARHAVWSRCALLHARLDGGDLVAASFAECDASRASFDRVNLTIGSMVKGRADEASFRRGEPGPVLARGDRGRAPRARRGEAQAGLPHQGGSVDREPARRDAPPRGACRRPPPRAGPVGHGPDPFAAHRRRSRGVRPARGPARPGEFQGRGPHRGEARRRGRRARPVLRRAARERLRRRPQGAAGDLLRGRPRGRGPRRRRPLPGHLPAGGVPDGELPRRGPDVRRFLARERRGRRIFPGAKLFRARFHQTRDAGATFTSRSAALGDDPELLEAERWTP